MTPSPGTVGMPSVGSSRLAMLLAALMLAGCGASPAAPSASPTSTAPVTSPPAATTPAATASPTPATPSATPTSTASGTPPLAGAIEGIPATDGTLNAIWVGPGSAVAGGAAGAVFNPTILRFDGAAWSVAAVPAELLGAAGQVMGIAEVGGTFFAVGNELPERRRGFIWFSLDDGATWEVSAAFDDAALYDIAASGSTAVAVGAHLDAENTPTAAAWASHDRGSWHEAQVESPDGQAIGSVTATTEGFAAIGDGATSTGAALVAWRTTDGISWSASEPDLPPLQLPTDMVEGPDGNLAISGASGKAGDQHPFVARSPDGVAWQQTILSQEEGYASAIVVAEAELAVAGVESDRLTLWSEADTDWQPEVVEASGAAISELAWDPLVGLVGAGSRDGQHAIWLLRGPR